MYAFVLKCHFNDRQMISVSVCVGLYVMSINGTLEKHTHIKTYAIEQ